MPIALTENEISQRLQDAIASGPSSDGFSEIELTEETRLKCAAVLIPLVWYDEEWHLLFTRRTPVVIPRDEPALVEAMRVEAGRPLPGSRSRSGSCT